MAQRDLQNILSGPCRITLGGIDLGHTQGETRLAIKPELRECYSAAQGKTAVDLIVMGEEASLSVRVAEWTLATLAKIYPATMADGNALGLGVEPGTRLAAKALAMALHPLDLADSDTSKDITFWLAVATGAVAIGFGSGKDRIFEVTFRLLPDPLKSAGETLGKIGA